MITVPKKSLLFVLPYLGPLSLQTNNLTKSLKGILKCCKLQVAFKSLNKFQTVFVLKIVFHRGSESSSYKIELRNRVTQNEVTLRATNSESFTVILLSSY